VIYLTDTVEEMLAQRLGLLVPASGHQRAALAMLAASRRWRVPSQCLDQIGGSLSGARAQVRPDLHECARVARQAEHTAVEHLAAPRLFQGDGLGGELQ
jgi:hypothetical protein